MALHHLFCPTCEEEQSLQAERCSRCGGLLAVALDRWLEAGEPHPFAGIAAGPMWRSNPVLPIADPQAIVSLGEGGTPCVRAARLGDRVEVWLKNESANPTGSFKDRQVSVGISHALDAGAAGEAAEFYVVSSGNVAAAAAAYCARAGAGCWVLAPGSAAAGKLLQIQLCGARVVRVDSPSQERLFELAEQAAAEFGWRPLSTAARCDPFNIVGARTIAGEILEQMPPPHWVVMPLGGGGLVGSVWQGFKEAARLRPGLRLPRLAAGQAAGCAPFVRAVQEGLSPAEALTSPWPEPHTIAGGLADDIPFDAHLALPAVRESDGAAVAVSDDDIRRAQRLLARREGLFIEPSGAVSIAALERLMADGVIARGERVCCVLTGSGLKDPASVEPMPPPPLIPPEPARLREVVSSARPGS